MMTRRVSWLRAALWAIAVAAAASLPSPARAACGAGTPFPQCDDVCPPGLVCAETGGVCGCESPAAACQDPGNPDGPPVCYGSCPDPAHPICNTFVGGCTCIPTLSEWGVLVMSALMFGTVTLRRRRGWAAIR